MTEWMFGGLVALAVAAVGAGGTAFGAWLSSRGAAKAASATAAAQMKTSEDTAQDKLIDQLQEELHSYRVNNDQQIKDLFARVEKLENENRGYRAFIGLQRDHMAEHGVPLPPWPEGLPR